ncbi:MAG TPA: hypothetical protein VNL69_00885 [Bacteroidota bacterium]|nr:hypothetical protein [Bacteroidota bacterium]
MICKKAGAVVPSPIMVFIHWYEVLEQTDEPLLGKEMPVCVFAAGFT